MVTRESESGQDLDDAASPGKSPNHSRRPAPRNAVAVAVIRWGRDASSDVLRKRARWTACGRRAGPWGSFRAGFLPFPTSPRPRRDRSDESQSIGRAYDESGEFGERALTLSTSLSYFFCFLIAFFAAFVSFPSSLVFFSTFDEVLPIVVGAPWTVLRRIKATNLPAADNLVAMPRHLACTARISFIGSRAALEFAAMPTSGGTKSGRSEATRFRRGKG